MTTRGLSPASPLSLWTDPAPFSQLGLAAASCSQHTPLFSACLPTSPLPPPLPLLPAPPTSDLEGQLCPANCTPSLTSNSKILRKCCQWGLGREPKLNILLPAFPNVLLGTTMLTPSLYKKPTDSEIRDSPDRGKGLAKFTQQVFIEHLLCARRWGDSCEQMR